MVEVYQFGPFNSEDGTMSLMHPSLSPTERLVKKSAYDTLAAELADAKTLNDAIGYAEAQNNARMMAAEARIRALEAASIELLSRWDKSWGAQGYDLCMQTFMEATGLAPQTETKGDAG